jgi:predicted Zn-dependent protease
MSGERPVDDSSAAVVPPLSDAIFYDGTSSRRHHVRLDLSTDCNIIEDGQIIATWPFSEIRRADGVQGVLRAFCNTAPPLARLEIRDSAVAAEFAARCENFDQHRLGRRGVAKIVGLSLAAAVSIVCVVIYALPLLADQITPLIPESYERRIGEAVDRQVKVIFAGKVCSNPQGRAAFAKLIEALRLANGMAHPVEAVVIENTVANAMALPGGKVYVLSDLIDKAENQDELAGILGHELGHVKNRDGLRNVVYTGGTSFLFGLLFGDVTGGGALIAATQALFNASYSRQAETNADTAAIDSMLKLGRSPKPMGELIFRITGAQGTKSIGALANHPLSEDRRTRLNSFDRETTSPPILTDGEWTALKAICK